MAKINDLINILSRLEIEHGNVEINIYHSFDKKTTPIDVSQIFYDDYFKDIYISIYS